MAVVLVLVLVVVVVLLDVMEGEASLEVKRLFYIFTFVVTVCFLSE